MLRIAYYWLNHVLRAAVRTCAVMCTHKRWQTLAAYVLTKRGLQTTSIAPKEAHLLHIEAGVH